VEAIVGPREGERLETESRTLLVKGLRSEIDLLEYEVGPDYEGPGPHFHKRHVDSFYVLEGELAFTVDGRSLRAPAGTAVVVPPGVVHAFTNPGPRSARFLNAHAPDCGFVDYLRARDRGDEVDATEYDIWDVE
jgi:mannose-6-phosphate isomerase-like protein (cupin superfamily)